MKKLIAGSLVAACLMLLAFAIPARAGTVTITSGPTFTPETSFTNNNFTATVVHNPPGVTGDQLQGSGGATVIPPASNSATVSVGGDFSANVGDIASVAYAVTMESTATVPIGYTTSANVTFLGIPQSFSGTGTIMPGLHHYSGTWQAPISFPVSGTGTFAASLVLDFAAGLEAAGLTGGAAGSLDVRIEQVNIQLATTAATVLQPSQALNIATRLPVNTGENVLIAGFINPGPATKRVLVRGIGPSLGAFLDGALANPRLQLFGGANQLYHNDDWKTDSVSGMSQQALIEATGLQPTNDLESVIVYTIDPGSYTAVLNGVNDTTGIGLVEIYDIDQASNSRLANISTRGFVGVGNNVMIAGVILGPGSRGASTIIVRGIGPSLTAFGVPNALADPLLELHDGDGALISSNDNWMDSANQQTFTNNGLAPTNANESAILAVPAPGNYTAILQGVGATTGVGLIEVYHFNTNL